MPSNSWFSSRTCICKELISSFSTLFSTFTLFVTLDAYRFIFVMLPCLAIYSLLFAAMLSISFYKFFFYSSRFSFFIFKNLISFSFILIWASKFTFFFFYPKYYYFSLSVASFWLFWLFLLFPIFYDIFDSLSFFYWLYFSCSYFFFIS